MALLIPTLNTPTGITYTDAVLVVHQANRSLSDNENYSISHYPSADGSCLQFNTDTNSNPHLHMSFSVWIFASESAALAGCPPVGQLYSSDLQQVFSCSRDSGSLTDDAYAELQALYPDAIGVDLSTVGLA